MRSLHHPAKGFSLVEVLVALVIVSIGLLGLAKMESLALSSADTAGTRTIASIQASSLAGMMHADHDYWGSPNATTSTVVTFTDAPSITGTNMQLASSTQTCTSAAPCTPLVMAQYDLYQWATTLQTLLPGFQATIACTPASLAAAPPSPVTCTITIDWAETAQGANAAQAAISNLTRPSYTLNVEP
jgi:type IV pilus assembly protein PilV